MFLQRFVGSVPKSVFRPLPLAVLMTVLGGQALAGEATTPDVAPPALALYGVIQKDEGSRFLGGESQRRARWYKVGDQIEGFEVREISAESVLVTKQGVDFTGTIALVSVAFQSSGIPVRTGAGSRGNRAGGSPCLCRGAQPEYPR